MRMRRCLAVQGCLALSDGVGSLSGAAHSRWRDRIDLFQPAAGPIDPLPLRSRERSVSVDHPNCRVSW